MKLVLLVLAGMMWGDGDKPAAQPIVAADAYKSPEDLLEAVTSTLRDYRDLADDPRKLADAQWELSKLDYALQVVEGVEPSERDRWRRAIARRQKRIAETREKQVRKEELKKKAGQETGAASGTAGPYEPPGYRQPAPEQTSRGGPEGYRRQWYWQGGGALQGGAWRGYRFAEEWGQRFGQGTASRYGAGASASRSASASASARARASARASGSASQRQSASGRQSGSAGQSGSGGAKVNSGPSWGPVGFPSLSGFGSFPMGFGGFRVTPPMPGRVASGAQAAHGARASQSSSSRAGGR